MTRDEHLDALGAYALDAVDEHERAAVEAYLDATPAARDEVQRLGFAVEALAASENDPAVPTGAWARIQDAMSPGEGAPALPPLSLDRDRSSVVPLRRSRRRVATLVLAVAAALVVGLGVGAVLVNRQTAVTEASVERLAEEALEAPGSRTGTLTGPGGVEVRAVVDADGRGYLFADDLTALPPGRTYQLWSLDAAAPVSLAVLGGSPAVVAFPAGSDTSALAITDEPAPGAVAPGQAPLAAGTLA